MASGIEVADDPLVGLNAAYDRGALLLRERDPRTARRRAAGRSARAQPPTSSTRRSRRPSAVRRQGVHGRRRGHRHDVPARRGRGGLDAPLRGWLGGAAPRIGGCAAGRGVAEPAPRRRHGGRSRRAVRLGVGAHTRAALAACDFTQFQAATGGAQRRQGGTESPPWVMTRAARRGSGPDRRSRGARAATAGRRPRPARRRRRVQPPPAAAPPPPTTVARSTPPPPPPPTGPPPRPPSSSTAPVPARSGRAPSRSARRRAPPRPPPTCPTTATSTASCRGSTSTPACWRWPRTPASRCWSGPSSWRSSRRNLDEFYMVRVAGLKRRDEAGLAVRSADGLTPREQLARISARTQALAVAHAKVFLDEVCPELDKRGHPDQLRWSDADRRPARRLSDLLHRARSSRCSRRWRSTRRTRSPTSPASRSTSPSPSATPRAAPSGSRG